MECLQQIGRVEYCIGCDSFQFFDAGSIGLCNFCGCHPPQGDFHDEEVPDEELNNSLIVRLGVVSPFLPWWNQLSAI